ncbi:MAG: DUF2461 domain-containing protein [Acidimicrobiia bacterium]|nr:DUF2461 domain-containing protein [Acidimicrobiia bacterium]
MPFNGFPKQSISFLNELKKNNNRAWFEDNRSDYEAYVMAPSREFVEEMGKRFAGFDPEVLAEPKVNSSIRRINRDTRFSADKTPYKDHLDFYFPHRAFKGRPLYAMRFNTETVGFGAGLFGFDDTMLARWRTRIDDDASGTSLARTLEKLKKAGFPPAGQHWKKVPKGFAEDHPRADLLRHNGIYVGADIPIPTEFHTKALPTLAMRHFRKFRPVVDWVTDMID